LPTIVASRENHAIVVPYLLNYHGGTDSQRDGTERSCGVDCPIPVIPTENRYGLVAPYLLAVNHGGDDDRSHSASEPLATLTTKTGHSLVLPFLTKYYGRGSCVGVEEPLDAITTKDHFGLACANLAWERAFPSIRYLLATSGSAAAQSLIQTMYELGVIDIGFRMLDPDELALAQGFPAGYYLHGSKADQVRQIGNAVCPPVAKAICQTLMEAA
jgi:DNA (cytosine-5)-methyltransferase 1